MSLFAIDFTSIIPIAVFFAIAAAAWWLMDIFSSDSSSVEDRLDMLKNPRGKKTDDAEAASSSDKIASMLEKATPVFAKPFDGKSEKEMGKLTERLVVAGFRRDSAPTVFMGLKMLMMLIGCVLAGGTMLIVSGLTKQTLLRTGMVAIIFFFLPDIILWWMGKKRKEAIFLSLPDTLDLMVVCVEAGLGLDQAMRKVADEMADTYKVICEEFNICNFQLQMGRTRNEVLQELGTRTGVDDVKSLASILIQADKFGSSVGQALRVQSESMRTRRSQIAEEKAAKTAVQLIFPLVLFIFPGVFVVLVGPAAITMIREMFPIMQQAGGG